MAKTKRPKYVFVVGGVMSSVGKGVASASIAKLVQARGYKVASIKCDMYVNVDAGTIRPAEHGEVYVGADGIEADQDLGNYERFTGQITTLDNYITTGQVYQEVIRRERNLEYGGEDVEVVPDVPKEIIRRIKNCQQKTKADIMTIEYGGTVGEYQLVLFLEAARMMKAAMPEDVIFVMVSYLPTPSLLGEQKSKPTQYAIRTLNSAGITPDFIMCRSDLPVSPDVKRTISNVCSLPIERIISAPNVESIYDVPIVFHKQDLGKEVLKALNLRVNPSRMKEWEALSRKIKRMKKEVKIAIVGKYFNMKSCKDTYISVIEATNHAAWHHGFKPKITWIDSESYEKDPKKVKELKKFDGVVVPGGWGTRGIEGKIKAIEYIRKNNIPYLGLCYGMQCAVIEFARNVLGWKDACTTEMKKKGGHPVIHWMPGQLENIKKKKYGGTLRLGEHPCQLIKGTKARELYGKAKVSERHRHRYEYNNDYRVELEEAGLITSGVNPEMNLVEIVELKDHPFFMGTQFHPEFKSYPLKPNPVWRGFLAAATKRAKK